MEKYILVKRIYLKQLIVFNMKRDKFHRCPICGLLSLDDDNQRDRNGYKCPNGCEYGFEQPPYQKPTNED